MTSSIITATNQSFSPPDWPSFYSDLQTKGNVPNASTELIGSQNAILRGMCLDFSAIKESIRQSGQTPILTTIYADVLLVPDLTNWLLQSTGLVIFARRIEVTGSATIILDYRQSNTAQLVVFADELVGTLTGSAVVPNQEQPVLFTINQDTLAPGISVNNTNGQPVCQPLQLQQGIGFQVADDMQLYLNNSFIFGSLLYDQNPDLALSIFLWVKSWAAQSGQFEDLFYRSTSLVTLLSAQINATANGAVFVPYLTSSVYTDLARAFASYASEYESHYETLSTQKTLTDENIALAKTMVANADAENQYVTALLQQANNNYSNAEAAATKAQINFNNQQLAVNAVQANFQQIGIPDYEREQIIKAIVSLVTAVVTFGAAIGAMAMGDEAAAPAAAEGAVNGAKAVAQAADTGAAVAKKASELADTMAKLKKLVEVLQKVYELAKAVKEVADNISSAQAQMNTIQEMKDTTDGADLSAADGWAIFKLKADDVLQDSVDKGIKFAADYKQALDILVIYGQSLSAAQLAVIKAGQQVAAITFQLHYTQQKQANLQNLVNTLKAGEAPMLAMMQQFYQKYLDAKSLLFAALRSYQASYFYWALSPSNVHPKIVDPVSNLDSGIQDITKITMDFANALTRFDPPPQVMKNTYVEITQPSVLETLRTTGRATWVVPLDNPNFAGHTRVRLSNIRVWLEGTKSNAESYSVYVIITTAGNYLDTYQGTNYQFNSKGLNRSFEYLVAKQGQNPNWTFDNGNLGFVQIDGEVDKEVAYAYFQPTPFSEWSISLLSNNPGLDYSAVSKITMSFEGSTIGSTGAAFRSIQL
ncbi:hypothetical protein [Spirosoma validum]|uniref:Uncharacterized protein n=1 Tax=Spirosoma validum TaxID=2771355 RepID=A0A927GCC2_9BACT|nr:hypothetical protein [Spirosoma validum]MBD2752514.1 hypothetical protein [Spirosoma validum]